MANEEPRPEEEKHDVRRDRRRNRRQPGVLRRHHAADVEPVEREVHPQRPKDRLWALYYLAMCFLNQGQTDMAVMQLETARDALPTMDDLKKNVIYQLGLCAEASGDLEKAYRYYKDVYSTDVGFEDLSERMLAVSQALKAQG